MRSVDRFYSAEREVGFATAFYECEDPVARVEAASASVCGGGKCFRSATRLIIRSACVEGFAGTRAILDGYQRLWKEHARQEVCCMIHTGCTLVSKRIFAYLILFLCYS